MLTEDYRVRLDAFEGPLDLLLYLIRKNEVDVHDIPVAVITEQYMEFLKGLESQGTARIDIDLAGEFLVMAATLMEIKARMLSPRPAATGAARAEEPGPDPRAELVRQLLAYKKYRDAAQALEQRADEWGRRFPSGPVGVAAAPVQEDPDAAPDIDIEDVSLIDLAEAFRRVSEAVNFERLGDHAVTYDDTPLELHAEDIVDRLRRDAPGTDGPGELEFATIFRGRTRQEMVGLFLALLDLCRRRVVTFRPVRETGEVLLRLRTEEERAADQAAVEAAAERPLSGD